MPGWVGDNYLDALAASGSPDALCVTAGLRAALGGGRLFERQWRAEDDRWFLTRVDRLPADPGQPVQAAAVTHDDVADRVTAEAQPAQTEAHTRTILAAAADGVVTIDNRGTAESYNASCERIFGHPAAEVVGRNVRVLMDAPFRDEHDGYLERYRATGGGR